LRAAVHNEFLQIWLELGLPGVLLALLLIVLLCRRLRRFDRDDSGLLYGGSLAVLMGVAMIGFPLQNPATGVLAAIIAGALSGRLRGPSGDDFEAPERPLILSLVSISVGLLALWQGRAELSAQWLMTRADILSRSGQIIAAVETLEQAIAVSDISPRLRTRLYPEVMAAGPRFWAKNYSAAQIEDAYALAVSASPYNPVLLDMRLKYLTHLPNLPVPCSQVEQMIKLFNPHFPDELVNRCPEMEIML
jgi:hypothetical protein